MFPAWPTENVWNFSWLPRRMGSAVFLSLVLILISFLWLPNQSQFASPLGLGNCSYFSIWIRWFPVSKGLLGWLVGCLSSSNRTILEAITLTLTLTFDIWSSSSPHYVFKLVCEGFCVCLFLMEQYSFLKNMLFFLLKIC